MPRLFGVFEYRFVVPDFRSDGRAWWPIRETEEVEAVVKRLDDLVVISENVAALCGAVDHARLVARTDRDGGVLSTFVCQQNADGRLCERLAQHARDCARTAERTLAIRFSVE